MCELVIVHSLSMPIMYIVSYLLSCSEFRLVVWTVESIKYPLHDYPYCISVRCFLHEYSLTFEKLDIMNTFKSP